MAAYWDHYSLNIYILRHLAVVFSQQEDKMALQSCLTFGTLSANHPNILETYNCLSVSAESFTPANRVGGFREWRDRQSSTPGSIKPHPERSAGARQLLLTTRAEHVGQIAVCITSYGLNVAIYLPSYSLCGKGGAFMTYGIWWATNYNHCQGSQNLTRVFSALIQPLYITSSVKPGSIPQTQLIFFSL